MGNTSSDLATYTEQLSAIADRLLKTKAKLLYLMTTPMMPECCDGAALLPSSEGAPVPACKSGASATYRCDSVVVRLNAAAAQVRRSMHQGCLLKPRNLAFYPFFAHFPPSFAHFQRLDARNPGSTARSPGENGKKSGKIVENRGN